MDVPERYLSSGLPSRRPLDEYPGSSHRPLRMYPSFTCKVAYHPVGHFASARRASFTCKVAYHPVGHLASSQRASFTCKVANRPAGHFASARAQHSGDVRTRFGTFLFVVNGHLGTFWMDSWTFSGGRTSGCHDSFCLFYRAEIGRALHANPPPPSASLK